MAKQSSSGVLDVSSRILLIRENRVLLDADLASLYGVSTKRLNEQVKRNADRFPSDFAFRLTQAEKEEVVANCDHLAKLKYSPALPRVFTEHGAIMAANVLQSNAAIEMSVFVVRAFVKMREAVLTSASLAGKLNVIERRLSGHDAEIEALVREMRKILAPRNPIPEKRRIGFRIEDS